MTNEQYQIFTESVLDGIQDLIEMKAFKSLDAALAEIRDELKQRGLK